MKQRGTGVNGGGASSQSRRLPRRLRVIFAGLLLAGLAAPASVAVEPQWTDAAWTDSEAAASAFTAITVPPPLGGGACSIEGSLLNLLSSKLTLRWQLPAGYTLADAGFSYTGSAGLVPAIDTLLGTNLKTVESGSVYTTTLTGALLNAVLGGTRTLSVQIMHSSGWVSSPRTVTGVWPLLGLGQATCSVTP